MFLVNIFSVMGKYRLLQDQLQLLLFFRWKVLLIGYSVVVSIAVSCVVLVNWSCYHMEIKCHLYSYYFISWNIASRVGRIVTHHCIIRTIPFCNLTNRINTVDEEQGSRWLCNISSAKRSWSVSTEILTVFPAKFRWSAKDIKLFTWDFDRPFTSQCHLDGPPLELMGPGVIVPPASPSRWPWTMVRLSYVSIIYLRFKYVFLAFGY